jgi:hypothetical protein
VNFIYLIRRVDALEPYKNDFVGRYWIPTFGHPKLTK